MKSIKRKIMVGFISTLLCTSTNCARRGRSSTKTFVVEIPQESVSAKNDFFRNKRKQYQPMYPLKFLITNTSNKEIKANDLETKYNQLQSNFSEVIQYNREQYNIIRNLNSITNILFTNGTHINMQDLIQNINNINKNKAIINKNEVITVDNIGICHQQISTTQKIKLIVKKTDDSESHKVEMKLLPLSK